MVVCITSGRLQMQANLNILQEYFKSSPVSTGFFLFLLAVITLDILKMCLIYREKKNRDLYQACIYLCSGRDGPECNHSSCKQGFKDRNGSCEGCAGKTLPITNEDVVKHIIAGATWKRIVIAIANCSRSILPYVSFIYTLFIAIFEKNS